MSRREIGGVIITIMQRLARRYDVVEVITDSGMGRYDTVVYDTVRGECYFYSQSLKSTANFQDISEDDLYACASYLKDNYETAEVREMLDLEKTEKEELDFVFEPEPVKVGEDVVAEVGVITDAKAGDVTQNVVVLMNSDGLSPVTVYDENDMDDVVMAIKEISAIIEALGAVIEKIGERNVMLNGTEEEKRRFLGDNVDEIGGEEEVLDID